MRKSLIIATAMIVGHTVQAQTVPPTPDILLPNGTLLQSNGGLTFIPLPSTGLGTNGLAIQGRPFDKQSKEATRINLFTGSNPGDVVTFTLNTKSSVIPPTRSICVAMADWTMPEYAHGYPIPEWPNVMFDGSNYDNDKGNVTIRVRILQGWDLLNKRYSAFLPNSNYSVSVVCPERAVQVVPQVVYAPTN